MSPTVRTRLGSAGRIASGPGRSAVRRSSSPRVTALDATSMRSASSSNVRRPSAAASRRRSTVSSRSASEARTSISWHSTAMAIVVGGEALIDLVPHAAGELRAHPGGGPYNTARTLGRLEQDVHYLGCLSGDGFGVRLRARLKEDRVRLDTAVATKRPTTLALADLDEAGAATYRFYTSGTSAPALTPEQALAALPEDVEFLHVGTLGLVMEPTAAALRAVVKAVADRALIMVDPNCRPTFIEACDAYRPELAATLRYARVVKVSDEALEYLPPGSSVREGARALWADGPAVALVTLGANGALIVTAESETPIAA